MKHTLKVITFSIFFASITAGAEVILQNNGSYSGCEDTYLSAIFSDVSLTDMIADSLTNFASDSTLHLTR